MGAAEASPRTNARGPVAGLVVALALVAAALGSGEAPAAPHLEVETAGCAAWRVGPVCETDGQAPLVLFVRTAPDADVSVALDGIPATLAPEPMQGGLRFRVNPGPATSLVVSTKRARALASYRVELTAPRETDAVKQARGLRRKGSLAEARAVLEGVREGSDARARTTALGLLGRLDLAAGDDAGKDTLTRAADEHRAAGRVSEALSDELALAFWAVFSGRRYDDAEAALGRARALADVYPEGRARLAAYEAMLAYETGRLSEAMVLLRASAAASERLGLTTYRASLVPLEADVDLALGRVDAARALVDEGTTLGASLTDPCDVGALGLNLAWVLARLGEQTGAMEAYAESAARSRVALAALDEACPRPLLRGNALTNLAFAELALGHTTEALAHLDEAKRAWPTPDAEPLLVWLEIEGRTAQGEAAIPALRRMEDVARALRSPVAALRTKTLLGDAFARLGGTAEAERAYAEADAQRDALAVTLPLEGGRLGFVGAWDDAAKRRIALQMKTDPAAAAELARRSIARTLGVLAWSERIASLPPEGRARWNAAVGAYRAEKARVAASAATLWTLPESELSRRVEAEKQQEMTLVEALAAAAEGPGHGAPEKRTDTPLRGPEADEVIVVMHPLPEGWAAFALEADHADATTWTPPANDRDPAKLAEALLARLAPAVARARSVRFVVHGALRDVDLHALPFEGEPLGALRTVTYGLDLPGSSRSLARRFDPRGPVMVVADPRGDLPHAREEAARVRAALEAGGSRVTDLAGDAASYDRVVEGLGCGELERLHFAGHGRFAGESGLASGLALSGNAWLTVADVLTMPSPPVEVVLSGCETARAGVGERPVGVGIAHAFLLAGSRVAIAATRPVDDALARRLMIAYYASPAATPAERLREAENRVRADRPDLDWAAFRALVP